MNTFKVGDKIVYVRDDPPPTRRPSVGSVYTIREIQAVDHSLPDGSHVTGVIVKLEGFPNGTPTSDVGYWAWRFRPVKKTSLDVFHKILKEVDDEVDA